MNGIVGIIFTDYFLRIIDLETSIRSIWEVFVNGKGRIPRIIQTDALDPYG